MREAGGQKGSHVSRICPSSPGSHSKSFRTFFALKRDSVSQGARPVDVGVLEGAKIRTVAA